MDLPFDSLSTSISPAWMPALIFIAILMPFWYIIIYLFHRDFYDKSTQVLKWAFCFCLSLVWFSTFAILALYKTIAVHQKEIAPNNEGGIPLLKSIVDEYYFNAGWMSIFVLVFMLVLAYFFTNKKRTRSFPTMIAIWQITLIVVVAVAILILKK
jgi:hypothetical protein